MSKRKANIVQSDVIMLGSALQRHQSTSGHSLHFERSVACNLHVTQKCGKHFPKLIAQKSVV